MKEPKLIAEVGCNHQGNLFLAKKMIETAVQYGRVDYVKFQKREVRELLSVTEYSSPHPNPAQSFGPTYGAHREFLELNLEQHAELKHYCDKMGTKYACSVWDVTSARKIISLEPDYIKVPSACNLDFDLLEAICVGFGGQIHISLGMTTQPELATIIAFLSQKNILSRCVLYSCVSAYPVPADQASLFDLKYLTRNYEGRVAAVGFSGHHEGILLDTVAFALGASWIERHFTLDKTWKGTDQSLSLDPYQLKQLRENLSIIASSLNYKAHNVLEIEELQRKKLKRKLVDKDQLHV